MVPGGSADLISKAIIYNSGQELSGLVLGIMLTCCVILDLYGIQNAVPVSGEQFIAMFVRDFRPEAVGKIWGLQGGTGIAIYSWTVQGRDKSREISCLHTSWAPIIWANLVITQFLSGAKPWI